MSTDEVFRQIKKDSGVESLQAAVDVLASIIGETPLRHELDSAMAQVIQQLAEDIKNADPNERHLTTVSTTVLQAISKHEALITSYSPLVSTVLVLIFVESVVEVGLRKIAEQIAEQIAKGEAN